MRLFDKNLSALIGYALVPAAEMLVDNSYLARLHSKNTRNICFRCSVYCLYKLVLIKINLSVKKCRFGMPNSEKETVSLPFCYFTGFEVFHFYSSYTALIMKDFFYARVPDKFNFGLSKDLCCIGLRPFKVFFGE